MGKERGGGDRLRESTASSLEPGPGHRAEDAPQNERRCLLPEASSFCRSSGLPSHLCPPSLAHTITAWEKTIPGASASLGKPGYFPQLSGEGGGCCIFPAKGGSGSLGQDKEGSGRRGSMMGLCLCSKRFHFVPEVIL